MFVAQRKRNRSEISATTEDIKTGGFTNGITTPKPEVPMEILWENVVLFAVFHLAALYGLYLLFTSAMWQTTVFVLFVDTFSGLGVTAGAHRLWSHRSYKAKLPLRIFLTLAHSAALQKDIYSWCRVHRTHHKFTDTNADPHNSRRGFFYSHIGWLLVRSHPDVIENGKIIDLSDLLEDPLVRFQRKYYKPIAFFMCFFLPTAIPMMFWQESFQNSFFVTGIFRYMAVCHQTALVNSAAHMWGYRPYEKRIYPTDNYWVTFLAGGEGFHNYHHTFPWDYATSEYGPKLNFTTVFINFAAWLGLAYDLKTVPPPTIQARKLKNKESE